MINYIDDNEAYFRLARRCQNCGHAHHCGYPCHEDGGGCDCEICMCEECQAPNQRIGATDI